MKHLFALALSLGLAIAATSCGAPDPYSESLEPPVRDLHPPPPIEYRGDVIGVRRTSAILERLSIRGQVSLVRLANAEVLTSSGLGPHARLSPHARAFRLLLQEPLAREAFLELSRAKKPEPALYGLCGLYFTDRPEFEAAAARKSHSNAPVQTWVGCLYDGASVATVIGTGLPERLEIRNGYWPSDLAGIAASNPSLQRTRSARR